VQHSDIATNFQLALHPEDGVSNEEILSAALRSANDEGLLVRKPRAEEVHLHEH
jgi:hypothetical protein